MRKVFLDTSFILACVNSNDKLHENTLKLEETEISHRTVILTITC